MNTKHFTHHSLSTSKTFDNKSNSAIARLGSNHTRLSSNDGRLTSKESKLMANGGRSASNNSRLVATDIKLTSNAYTLTPNSRLGSNDARLTSNGHRLASNGSKLPSNSHRLTSRLALLSQPRRRLARESLIDVVKTEDVFLVVFSFVSICDLVVLSQVCKRFYQITLRDCLWERHYFNAKENVSTKVIEKANRPFRLLYKQHCETLKKKRENVLNNLYRKAKAKGIMHSLWRLVQYLHIDFNVFYAGE
jgi:hypothetical protein